MYICIYIYMYIYIYIGNIEITYEIMCIHREREICTHIHICIHTPTPWKALLQVHLVCHFTLS